MSTTMDALMIGLMLVLPLTALAARRMPVDSLVRMVAAWIASFAAATLLVLAWRAFTSDDGATGDVEVRTDVASLLSHQKLT